LARCLMRSRYLFNFCFPSSRMGNWPPNVCCQRAKLLHRTVLASREATSATNHGQHLPVSRYPCGTRASPVPPHLSSAPDPYSHRPLISASKSLDQSPREQCDEYWEPGVFEIGELNFEGPEFDAVAHRGTRWGRFERDLLPIHGLDVLCRR
jgi:hypothetical protein